MNDILPPESAAWQWLEGVFREHLARYAYGEVRTPVVESTALFSRGIGEATDIVEKEMYTFADRKQRSLTMRPEMTASCVRAFIQHRVANRAPVHRWYYIGPMFRYERAQTGRYRQFHQIGVEAFGIEEPTIDAEQITMLSDIYHSLGIDEIDIRVNNVGSAADRPAYRSALVEFLAPRRARLCPDCQRRLEKNPLRVLDCKVAACATEVAEAPRVVDFLGDASRAHFDGVQEALSAVGIGYRVDPRLVRGLDYYTGTVFEFTVEAGELAGKGSQSAIAAGGRYDGLVEALGGKAMPAVGFALGVERTLLSLPAALRNRHPDLFLVAHADVRSECAKLAHDLRSRGFRVDSELRTASIKSQFKRADKSGAHLALVLGQSEVDEHQVKVKDLKTSEESTVSRDDLEATLRARLSR